VKSKPVATRPLKRSQRLGAAIQAALDDLGMEQRELAEKIGMPRSYLNQLVNGRKAGGEAAAQIVRGLPAPWNGRVLAAWVSDVIDPSQRGLLTVLPLEEEGVVREGSEGDELPKIYGHLDNQRKELIRWIFANIHRKEFADVLSSQRKFVLQFSK
jgi:transcriptional regulator with XRE-family HTH domain